jgi:hypothetical protein
MEESLLKMKRNLEEEDHHMTHPLKMMMSHLYQE